MKIVFIHKDVKNYCYWVETDDGTWSRFPYEQHSAMHSAMHSALSHNEEIMVMLIESWLENRKEQGLKWLNDLDKLKE